MDDVTRPPLQKETLVLSATPQSRATVLLGAVRRAVKGRRRLLVVLAVLLLLVVSGLVVLVACRPHPVLRGLAFAPFRDCQTPELGRFPTLEQMRADVDMIAERSNAVRTYSSLNGMDEVAAYAKEKGLRVAAGAWLGPEKTEEGRRANRLEIDSLVRLADRVNLDSVIVGNEVLLRGDLTTSELAAYIREVKGKVRVPVTTAEIASVAIDPKHREVMDAVDYLMVHIYPYWDGAGIEGAAWYVVGEFRKAAQIAGKRVVIGETGWPSAGPPHGLAEPSVLNAERFLKEWIAVARDENIDYYYFAANDEPWKQEGGVGAYWGMLDADRKPKHSITTLQGDPGPALPRVEPRRAPEDGPPSSDSPSSSGGSATPPTVLPDVLPVYSDWPGMSGGFVPSGHMGDLSGIAMDDCVLDDRHSGRSAIRATYTPDAISGVGWAGVAWQLPTKEGTAQRGWDLRGYRTLSFWARGAGGGEKITFFAGGGTTPSGVEAPKEEILVALSRDWRQYKISLIGLDLSQVGTVFGWAASEADNPSGATFHLDDIQLDHSPPPRRICTDPRPQDPEGTIYVIDGATLCSRNSPVHQYEIGLDSSAGQRYLQLSTADNGDSLTLKYDPDATTPQEDWGALFVTVGKPVDNSRPGQDLAGCHTLQADLRSQTGTSRLRVGMKDATMPDDGREKKILVEPTNAWATYSFHLSTFSGLDPHRVYVPFELVFEAGDPAQTVQLANVRFLCGTSPQPPQSGTPVHRPCLDVPARQRHILAGSLLCPGYDLGLNTSNGATTWLTNHDGYLRMAYPADQTWGAVFITVGQPQPAGNLTGQDLSRCSTLQVDLRGGTATGSIRVGMKDTNDPDNGSETQVLVPLTSSWSTKTFPLSRFATLNRRSVYIVIEFVFDGPTASTIEFRNIHLDCKP